MSVRSRSKQAGNSGTSMIDIKTKLSGTKHTIASSRRTKDYSLITPSGKHAFRTKETRADDIFSKGVTERKNVNEKVAANNKLAG